MVNCGQFHEWGAKIGHVAAVVKAADTCMSIEGPEFATVDFDAILEIFKNKNRCIVL